MQTRTFEHTVQFRNVEIDPGVWESLPIITVGLVQPDGSSVELPLLFDTGANVTSLRWDLYPLLGLSSWDIGGPIKISTANGIALAYQYDFTLELFGKRTTCPIRLMKGLPSDALFMGLFGREGIFQEFGFGFWESSKELYVTLQP